MKSGLLAALVMMMLGWTGGDAGSAEPDPVLSAEQAQLEAGDDLSSRARRALFRARARQDEGEFAAAATIMTTWLDGDPDREHHLLRFNLAVSDFGLERIGEARVNLERAVALAPRYGRAWLRLGEAAYELEEFGQAGQAFVQAYDLSPDHPPAILYYAGVSLLSGGQPGPALDNLARLIDTHPAAAGLDWYQALLAAAAAAEQPARAMPYLDKMLAEQADTAEAWELAYRFHAGRADYEQAAVHLTIAGHLRELSRRELIQLGDLYAVIGVSLQAARYYEQAFTAATEPTAAEYRKLATAWLVAHEVDAARATLQTALAARPTAALWALQGDLEYGAENYTVSLAAFTHSTELNPNFGRGYLMMGYCAWELGRQAAARRHLDRAADFPAQAAAARSLTGTSIPD